MTTHPLEGRRAIVTGGGGGIGAACAELLGRNGAAVAVLDVRGDAAAQTAEAIAAAGRPAIGLACDVGSGESVAGAVGAVAREFGGLEIVVAAAGIARAGRTDELSLDEWDAVIRVNLTGVFLTLKHTLGHLVAGGGGAVVTIGSVASLVAAGRAGSYDAAKGACCNSRAHSARPAAAQ